MGYYSTDDIAKLLIEKNKGFVVVVKEFKQSENEKYMRANDSYYETDVKFMQLEKLKSKN